jgi:hypothetical protein
MIWHASWVKRMPIQVFPHSTIILNGSDTLCHSNRLNGCLFMYLLIQKLFWMVRTLSRIPIGLNVCRFGDLPIKKIIGMVRTWSGMPVGFNRCQFHSWPFRKIIGMLPFRNYYYSPKHVSQIYNSSPTQQNVPGHPPIISSWPQCA